MAKAKEPVFMLPGPVKMAPRVLKVMSSPPINHRGPEFKVIMKELQGLAKYMFQSDNEVVFLTGSGTAAMDAAIGNMARKGDKILNIVNGKFSERLNKISNVYATGKALNFEWGTPIEPEKVASALEEDDYKFVTFTHNETSTGLTNPAKEIGKVVKKKGAVLLVDAITSVGGMKVDIDDWGFDVTIIGSQKCLAAPPGIGLLSISKRAEEMLHEGSTFYLNLKRHIKELNENSQTPWTPAVPVFLALRESLRMLKEEGIENRIKRTAKVAEAARSAVKALGIKLFPDERFASNTVTAMRYPPGIVDKEFRDILREEYRTVIAGGQSQLKGKIFRIGHMGIVDYDDLLACFGNFEAVFKKLGYEFKQGASLRAIEEARD